MCTPDRRIAFMTDRTSSPGIGDHDAVPGRPVTVWVENWQMQCCGDPFKQGDTVEWTVLLWAFDPPAVQDIGQVDYYYENHANGNTDLLRLSGTVTSVQQVFQQYELRHDTMVGRDVRVPVGGYLAITDQAADGWVPDREDGRFSAYLATVDPQSVSPVAGVKG